MSMVSTILTWAVMIFVGFAVVGFVLSRFYVRATKETAWVRTGLGGAVVFLDRGGLSLPVLHQIMPINLKTMKYTVSRIEKEALTTKDKMRADVVVEFYARVEKTKEGIEAAAESLGGSTNDPTALRTLLEGKFVDALRSVAASMTLEDLHLNRKEFIQSVRDTLTEDLAKNGLKLEMPALIKLEQTARNFFDPNNAFDAEGLTLLTQTTESRRKERFEIESKTKVEIAERERETTQETLKIQRQTEEARLEQERDLATRRAETESEVARKAAEARRDSEQARIHAERQIEQAQIEAKEAIDLANQQSQISVAKKSEERSAAQASADKARASAVQAEEAVVTTRAVAEANRKKDVELVFAQQKAEEEAIGIRVAAQAERAAAEERAEALRIAASGEAEAEKQRAEGKKAMYEVEAEGQRALNEARNLLSNHIIEMEVRTRIIEGLPAILAAATKPMENIDSIKIMQVNGMDGMTGGAAVGDASGGSLPDQVVNAALRHKAVSPMIDAVLEQVGMGGTAGLTSLVAPVTEALNPGKPAEANGVAPKRTPALMAQDAPAAPQAPQMRGKSPRVSKTAEAAE